MAQTLEPTVTEIPWPVGMDPAIFHAAADDPAAVEGIRAWMGERSREYYPPASLQLQLRRAAYCRARVLRPFLKILGDQKARFNPRVNDDPVDVFHNCEAVLSFTCPSCAKEIGWSDSLDASFQDQDDEDGFYAGWVYGRHKDYESRCRFNPLKWMEGSGWKRPRVSGGAVDWEAVPLMGDSEPTWLIPGIMERGQLAALFGPPKVGKSLRALDWARELVTAEGHTRVLYLDRENILSETWRRLASMGARPDSLKRLTYISFPEHYVDTDGGAEGILDLVNTHRPDLVIFDSWARFFTGGQSDDVAANRVYGSVILPMRKQGIGVLRLDHTGHEGKRPSGTIVKLADIDHGWRINAKGDEVTLTHTENRTGRGADIIRERRITSPTLRHVPAGNAPATDADLPAGDNVGRLVDALDRLSIPIDWGRDRTKRSLVEAGVSARNDDLAFAIARRRFSS